MKVGDIEPYDGKDDLTPQQEERQEWLDETASQVEEAATNLEQAEDALDSIE